MDDSRSLWMNNGQDFPFNSSDILSPISSSSRLSIFNVYGWHLKKDYFACYSFHVIAIEEWFRSHVHHQLIYSIHLFIVSVAQPLWNPAFDSGLCSEYKKKNEIESSNCKYRFRFYPGIFVALSTYIKICARIVSTTCR